ncbi:MAG: nucleoside deaminase [Gammaproteobacteria bacterium]|nr:nucleoside deaminase [Gammaproteobacteria bacterium]
MADEQENRLSETKKNFMRRAIVLSREKMDAGYGGPFGAVIVRADKVIAEGFNQVTSSNDPTAHAEVVAIRKACEILGDFSLAGCEIYTSCEPCPMCLSAVYWARLERIFYANTREDAAKIGFDDDLLYREIPKPVATRNIPAMRILGDEAREVFQEWQSKIDKVLY